MLDFLIILAISYFIGMLPLAFFIKSKIMINLWDDKDDSLGVMKIHEISGLEGALLLLAGYSLKGFFGLMLANHLWGNDFINFPAALLIVFGQYHSHSGREAGGIIPVLIGAAYFWNISFGGTLCAVWISVYFLTKRIHISNILAFSLGPIFLVNYSVSIDFILFVFFSALLVFKNHIINKRASFNERRI